ncbi:MAG: tRNA lysidine(34) synthetase TilS [Candidatus Fluviicola riflensis]|nr:MAG: tRNA lysidine(34) synthetase TilS [Candidatus Fluviicola riflensis]OGS85852.1 MAG: tRNA lysidine(34) synthetase TilS [Fluviicola sp. RIFCSPHIGHO2_12_FULL_43_24]OGS86261.1 MAG: tRNA lysidine(34) synthetase TilS [Fluviicola sp. RIFCSPHIGHO2_01_FULL_43_53]
MVLLHGLLQIGLKPEVMHVNYGLRGADSDADEQLVTDFAHKHGLNLHVYKCPAELTQQPGINLQAAARTFRRNYFQEWTAQSPNHIVVLAHHANDQVETFFLQLYRGSGTFGLGGMHPERNQLVRPFLEIEKADLIAYALENNVQWREDKSNASSKYLRNLFRNELLPLLTTGNPDLNQSILLLMRLFRERQAEITAKIQEMSIRWKETGELTCESWLQLSEEEQVAFLHNSGLPLWSRNRFAELALGRTSARFFVGNNEVIKQDSQTIVQQQNTSDFPWDFKIEKIEILPLTFDKWTIYLDADRLSGELYLRVPEPEDRIDTVGLKGSQAVKAALKDFGIPVNKREYFPVLTDGKTVLWLPGIKVGRSALANQYSTTILKVSMNPFV